MLAFVKNFLFPQNSGKDSDEDDEDNEELEKALKRIAFLEEQVTEGYSII